MARVLAAPLYSVSRKTLAQRQLQLEHLVCRHKTHVAPAKRVGLALIGKASLREEEQQSARRTIAVQLRPVRKGAKHL